MLKMSPEGNQRAEVHFISLGGKCSHGLHVFVICSGVDIDFIASQHAAMK